MQRQQILIGVSHRRTALLWAATTSRAARWRTPLTVEVVRVLVERALRRTRVVELLIAAGADLAAKDNDG